MGVFVYAFVCVHVCVCVCTCMSLYEHVCTAEDTLGQAIWLGKIIIYMWPSL